MSLLHVSIKATDPHGAATTLARILGGEAFPFPPCPGAWIAFAAADDGSAIEVYPETALIEAGPATVAFTTGPRDDGASFAHAAIASPLSAAEICAIGAQAEWSARICDRGPFSCVELWIDGRILIEVLDPAMQAAYRTGMTAANWRGMFGFDA